MSDVLVKERLLRDLEGLRARVVECFRDLHPERIILFGSAARGEVDQWSDVDLIVVMQTEKRFLDRLEGAYLRWTLPVAVDILVYTPEEYQTMLDEENPLVREAITHGIVLYEKSRG